MPLITLSSPDHSLVVVAATVVVVVVVVAAIVAAGARPPCKREETLFIGWTRRDDLEFSRSGVQQVNKKGENCLHADLVYVTFFLKDACANSAASCRKPRPRSRSSDLKMASDHINCELGPTNCCSSPLFPPPATAFSRQLSNPSMIAKVSQR